MTKIYLSTSFHICTKHNFQHDSKVAYVSKSGKRSVTFSLLVHVLKLGTFRLQNCEFCSLVHSNCLQSWGEITDS
jgi:hypothetical protein